MPAAIQQSQMESDRLSAIKTIDSEIRAIEELKNLLMQKVLQRLLILCRIQPAELLLPVWASPATSAKK